MEIEEITIQYLTQEKRIGKTLSNDVWYFSKDDLNALFDDNFKFVDSKIIRSMGPDNVFVPMEYISSIAVMEHVEHRRNMTSFGDTIRRITNPGKK